MTDMCHRIVICEMNRDVNMNQLFLTKIQIGLVVYSFKAFTGFILQVYIR